MTLNETKIKYNFITKILISTKIILIDVEVKLFSLCLLTGNPNYKQPEDKSRILHQTLRMSLHKHAFLMFTCLAHNHNF